MRKFILALTSSFLILSSSVSKADPGREFIMLTTYGVLAGTLVGVASLAFTSQPGDNLKNIAKGASLGLYAGILLGAYVVYVVPGQIAAEQEASPTEEKPQEGGEGQEGSSIKILPVPIIGQNGVEGAGVIWQPLTF